MSEIDHVGFCPDSKAADNRNSQGFEDDGLCRRIFDAAGLVSRRGDDARLRICLAPRLHALGIASLLDYANIIFSGGDAGRREREWLFGEFTTGETYFMRDRGLFELLAERIVPELLARGPARRPLRVWSAGCASGEEAYSIAILFDELALHTGRRDVRIVGTDISSDAMARACDGVYGKWSFRSLDAARVERYFRSCRAGLQVAEHLRAMVAFERRDLMYDALPEPGEFDLILCRNVFIYLSPIAIERIVEKLAAGLAPGGYLIPGHAELLGAPPRGLELLAFPEALLYHRRHIAATSSHETAVPVTPPPLQDMARAPRRQPATGPSAATAEDPVKLLAKAWRDADRGAIESARVVCNRALQLAPFDPKAYYLLAQLAQERGAVDEARRLLRKVLYLDPQCVAAHLELAELTDQLGDTQGARRNRAHARRELARMPPDTVLGVPADTMAGTLLRGLSGEARDGNGGDG